MTRGATEKPNVILTTGCNDKYMPLLCDMLESLGNKLQQHDLGIVDLGLSEESKNKIKSYKSDCQIVSHKWFFDVPEEYKSTANAAVHIRLFQPEVFPNYDGYMHIDADVWFADTSAIDDIISTADSSGVGVIEEPFDSLREQIRFFGIKIGHRPCPPDYLFIKRHYGQAEAERLCGKNKLVNGGLTYVKGNHPLWKEWQIAGKKLLDYAVKTKPRKVGLSDQTSLLYALLDSGMERTTLPYTHNAVLHKHAYKRLLLDKNDGRLLDGESRNPIKVVHLTGDTSTQEYPIATTDGDTLKTFLTYNTMKKLFK